MSKYAASAANLEEEASESDDNVESEVVYLIEILEEDGDDMEFGESCKLLVSDAQFKPIAPKEEEIEEDFAEWLKVQVADVQKEAENKQTRENDIKPAEEHCKPKEGNDKTKDENDRPLVKMKKGKYNVVSELQQFVDRLPDFIECDGEQRTTRKRRKVSTSQSKNFIQTLDCRLSNVKSSERCIECCQEAETSSSDTACRFRNFRMRSKTFLRAYADDVRRWNADETTSNGVEMSSSEACFVLHFLMQPMERLLKAEKDFLKKHINFDIFNSSDGAAWKKPMNYREICDTCHACIFNLHLFCMLCGMTTCRKCSQGERFQLKNQRHDDLRFLCPDTERHSFRRVSMKLAQVIPDANALLQTLSDLRCSMQNVWHTHKNRDAERQCECATTSLLLNPVEYFGGEYYFDGELLILNEPNNENSLRAFQTHWMKYRPVVVRNVDRTTSFDIWRPQILCELSRNSQMTSGSVQDCIRGNVYDDFSVEAFWQGFIDCKKRTDKCLLKLKDWPSNEVFALALPEHYENFCRALPFPKYSHPTNGVFSLTTHLPSNYVKPDLGPKLYCAYEMVDEPTLGSTNLHIDGCDAANLLVNVTVPKNRGDNLLDKIDGFLSTVELDPNDRVQIGQNMHRVGALWTIFKPEDTETIRVFLKTIVQVQKRADPIHDQMRYLHAGLRKRLKEECGVEGFTFVQMLGDAVFIPVGAAHQVQNLVCCVKIAEDFVSPEGVNKCAAIDEEFRQLSSDHTNHEDKLQLPNVIVHSVKEAVRVLRRDLNS